MAITIQSNGKFAEGFGFGEVVSRKDKTVKMPDHVLTKLNSIGIMTVEDLLISSYEEPNKVASAMHWPASYVRTGILNLLPKLVGVVDDHFLKEPKVIKMENNLGDVF